MKPSIIIAAVVAVIAYVLWKAHGYHVKYDAPYDEIFDEMRKDPKLLLPTRDYHDVA